MKNVTISGSDGTFEVDAITGRIIDNYDVGEDYEKITQFDMAEFNKWWQDKMPDTERPQSIDILDVGFWEDTLFQSPEYGHRMWKYGLMDEEEYFAQFS